MVHQKIYRNPRGPYRKDYLIIDLFEVPFLDWSLPSEVVYKNVFIVSKGSVNSLPVNSLVVLIVPVSLRVKPTSYFKFSLLSFSTQTIHTISEI